MIPKIDYLYKEFPVLDHMILEKKHFYNLDKDDKYKDDINKLDMLPYNFEYRTKMFSSNKPPDNDSLNIFMYENYENNEYTKEFLEAKVNGKEPLKKAYCDGCKYHALGTCSKPGMRTDNCCTIRYSNFQFSKEVREEILNRYIPIKFHSYFTSQHDTDLREILRAYTLFHDEDLAHEYVMLVISVYELNYENALVVTAKDWLEHKIVKLLEILKNF